MKRTVLDCYSNDFIGFRRWSLCHSKPLQCNGVAYSKRKRGGGYCPSLQVVCYPLFIFLTPLRLIFPPPDLGLRNWNNGQGARRGSCSNSWIRPFCCCCAFLLRVCTLGFFFAFCPFNILGRGSVFSNWIYCDFMPCHFRKKHQNKNKNVGLMFYICQIMEEYSTFYIYFYNCLFVFCLARDSLTTRMIILLCMYLFSKK